MFVAGMLYVFNKQGEIYIYIYSLQGELARSSNTVYVLLGGVLVMFCWSSRQQGYTPVQGVQLAHRHTRLFTHIHTYIQTDIHTV